MHVTTRQTEWQYYADAITFLSSSQEKAHNLAGAVNVRPGYVLNIDENSWSYYGGPWSGRYQPQAQNVMQDAPSRDQPPSDDGPIRLGQIAVQAEVQVRLGLK